MFSVFNTSDYRDDWGSDAEDPDPPTCQYRGYRNGPEDPYDAYGLSPHYWHVFAARLAFVVVFEVSLISEQKFNALVISTIWNN